MHRGYIRLWRKSFDSGLHRNHKAFVLWVYILSNVTHKKYECIAGNKKIILMPGQMITGRKRLAHEIGASERNIRTSLALLKNIGNLTIKTTNRYSLITVVNWGFYQSDKGEPTSKPTKDRPSSDQQVTTKQEYKNINTKKRERAKKRKTLPPENFMPTDQHLQRANELGVDCKLEAEKWVNWCHATNNKYANHNRAFSNWLIKASEYYKRDRKDPNDDPCYTRLN
jgi:hypothetical protein